jgi:hypothetical protein
MTITNVRIVYSRRPFMSAVDYVFIAGFVVALALMLLCSKVIRAIFWDTVRHPFTPSRVEVYEDGEVRVVHLRFPK